MFIRKGRVHFSIEKKGFTTNVINNNINKNNNKRFYTTEEKGDITWLKWLLTMRTLPPKQRQQQVQQNHHFQFQEQDHNNISCTSYMSHHHPSPFFPADHQPFPNLPFSPKSLQKQFPQQQHDNTDSIGQWSV